MKRQINIENAHVHRVGTVGEWQEKVRVSQFIPKQSPSRKVLSSIRDVVGAKQLPTMSEAFSGDL